MTETLIMHWILAKVYSADFVQNYIKPFQIFRSFEQLSIHSRDFFNFAYLRENIGYFHLRNYKKLYNYYRIVADELPHIWHGRAKHLIFCNGPRIWECLEDIESNEQLDFSTLDSMYEEFQSYRFLSANMIGIVITKDLDRISLAEGRRPNLQKLYEAEIRKAQETIWKGFFKNSNLKLKK